MKNKTKQYLLPLCVTLLLLLPMLLVLGVLILAKPQFSNTFYGALNEKHDRLEQIEKPKIVLVGGSSAAFGFDSQLMEEKTGYEVVNFGLYADLGTKIMLELSAPHINEGDIVILAPEMDSQTLSLFFNGLSSLKAIDDDPSMLFSLDGDDWGKMWGAVWTFTAEKLSYMVGETPDPEGVYNAGNFNEYGDIAKELFPRTDNVMSAGYDPAKPIKIDASIYDAAFVEYLNDYIADAEREGAKVYYTFSPINDKSVVYDTAEDALSEPEQLAQMSRELMAWLDEALNCPVLSTPAECVMDSFYFYDSNFHLNDHGVPIHTARIIDALLTEEGSASHDVSAEIVEKEGYVWQDECFVYRKNQDNTCAIIALTDVAKRAKQLAIPSQSKNCVVTDILDGVLATCRALDLVMFSEGSRVDVIREGMLQGLSNLSTLLFCNTPPSAFLAKDVLPQNVSLLVLASQYDAYVGSVAFAELQTALSSVPQQTAIEMAEVINQGIEDLLTFIPRVEEDGYFVYTERFDGTWSISGLTDLGKTASVLHIPTEYFDLSGKKEKVTGIEPYAFAGGTVSSAVVMTSDSNINGVSSFAFANSNVTALYLYKNVDEIAENITSDVVLGARDDFRIYVYGESLLSAYINHYSWSQLASFYELTNTPEEEVQAPAEVAKKDSYATEILLGILASLVVVAAISLGIYWIERKAKAIEVASQTSADDTTSHTSSDT